MILSVESFVFIIALLISIEKYQGKSTIDIVVKDNESNNREYSEILKKEISTFWKPTKFRKINCQKLVIGKKKYIKKQKLNRKKIKEVSENYITSCDDIKKRGYFPDQPLTKEEKEFPLAYAINVYQDYLKLEQQFIVMYAPQNHYCYAIDKKSNPTFKKNVNALAECFPNIYIVKSERYLDHSGVNGNYYNYECMKLLKEKNYKYLFLLQNDDVPLKTNLELVKILKIYNGTIDMNIGDPIAKEPIKLDPEVSFAFDSLQLFKKSDKRFLSKNLGKSSIKIQKGLMQASIPKTTVDYILNEINIEKLLSNLNRSKCCLDELLWPTLFTNPYLAVPGWQHYDCSRKTIFSKYYMTRLTFFDKPKKCISHRYRHGICLFGVETLSKIRNLPHFFGNKFRSHFDAGASMCWLEYMYKKKYFLPFEGIDEKVYLNSPLVRYQKLKKVENDHKKICDMIGD